MVTYMANWALLRLFRIIVGQSTPIADWRWQSERMHTDQRCICIICRPGIIVYVVGVVGSRRDVQEEHQMNAHLGNGEHQNGHGSPRRVARTG